MPDPDVAARTLMYAEAKESGDAVARLLEGNRACVERIAARLSAVPPAVVLTAARGSSDHACTYGRYLIENRLGIVTSSIGLSTASIYDAPAPHTAGLCIAVSQSGASPDLLAAVARAKAGGAVVVGLINQPDSPLAAMCDEVIALSAGPERSVAATKSFICSLAALAWIVAAWSRDEDLLSAIEELPLHLASAWEQDWWELAAALVDARQLFILGRGPGLGIAQEMALKLKETSQLHAEAFSSAEVVHGPMALVGAGFPVLSLVQSDASGATSRATAADMAERGANVMIAGGEAVGAKPLPTLPGHPALEPIMMTLSFYRAAASLSLARGLDPDQPPHLAKVTRTR
ncbi:SIS domain-containing protein [Novosphingobium sp. PS1R-30]|uniref:SIS domain-containing protein n=1 Tax=Novosphingobium anseongense TaxID=3133436 RepID=A0ABU8S0G4_9SPHN